jgi:hypothetical protein
VDGIAAMKVPPIRVMALQDLHAMTVRP